MATPADGSAFAKVHQGDHAGAIDACRRALDTSRDHFNTSRALSVLGLAHARTGAPVDAIAALERAERMIAASGTRTLQGMFLAWLSEAHRLNGDLARARQSAIDGISIAAAVNFPFGLAAARRALGEAELAGGEVEQAIEQLTAARDLYVSIDSAFEAERTRARMAAAVASA